MAARAPGPAPPRRDPWTGDDVDRWLKAGFRAMPYTPIFAPRGNALRTIRPDIPDATFDIIAFTGTVLGDQSEDRTALLFYARVMATKGDVGGSVAEFCRTIGWSPVKFWRRRKRAAQLVADAKNRRDKQ